QGSGHHPDACGSRGPSQGYLHDVSRTDDFGDSPDAHTHASRDTYRIPLLLALQSRPLFRTRWQAWRRV
ncbi:MAG: hypothetical protein V1724_04230, partial [Chloroflexota bacterium]